MALELLAVCGVGPRTVRLLWKYWDRLAMVAKDGRYFGRPFKGYQYVTQGNLLSPIIFNMVFDAVVRHRVTVVTPPEVGTGGLGLTIIHLVDYFYAEDGLVVSTQPERLQRAFELLTGFFDRVGLRKNTEKMVGTVCQPCHAPEGVSEESYARQTTGKGPTFCERQRRRVEFPECVVEVAAGFLLTYCQIQNDVGKGDRG